MHSEDPSELDALVINSQADLQHLWELLMQPLGWRVMSLWVTLIGADRRPTKFLLQGAHRCGVPVEPVHVATDVAIWAVTPDDLAA